MSDFKAKCTKFDFRWGSAPAPAGGDYSAPPDHPAGIKGATSQQGGRTGRNGGKRDGAGAEEEGRERKGRDGPGKGKGDRGNGIDGTVHEVGGEGRQRKRRKGRERE